MDAWRNLGRALAYMGKVKNVEKHRWNVEHVTDEPTATVEYEAGKWWCTCQDWARSKKACKDIHAVWTDIECTPAERLEIGKHERRDWGQYNKAAQEEDGDLFETLLRDLVNYVVEPPHERGRPRHPLNESLFIAIMKVAKNRGCRRGMGAINQAARNGRLEIVPHFTFPSKLLNRRDLTRLLEDLLAVSAKALTPLETNFALDSTGFRTTQFGYYHGERHGEERVNIWRKAHFAVGVRTHVIAGLIVTEGNAGDSPQFQPLLEKVERIGFQMEEVYADAAYSSRANLSAAARLGATPYIMFRANASGKKKGSEAWARMHHMFSLERDKFDLHYHQRSNVEAVISAIKRKLGEELRSRNWVAQHNEMLCKAIAYNIGVVIHAIYEHNLAARFEPIRTPREANR